LTDNSRTLIAGATSDVKIEDGGTPLHYAVE